MLRLRWLGLVLLLGLALCGPVAARARKQPAARDIVIAQISDSHLGSKEAPNGVENLKRVVAMVNERHPDAVVMTGDLAENPDARRQALDILHGLEAPLYIVPGNHDESSTDFTTYARQVGKNYYKVRVGNVVLLAIDSQLLGNYDHFRAADPEPLPADAQQRSRAMLDWLRAQAPSLRGKIVIAMQHVPISRTPDGFPQDPKPYWTVQERYRSQEIEILHQLGVKHILLGHWHYGTVYDADGFTCHVAPSTGRILFGGQLGFAVHTIGADGSVKTDFVYLEGKQEGD